MTLYFTHPTATGKAPTASQIFSTNRQLFKQQVYDGVHRPLVFPYNYLGILILIIYLCIPHKQNSIIYAARWPVLGLITWFELRVIQESSGVGMGLGYNIGIFSSVVIMLSWTWLIFRKPQWDAKRVERRRVRVVNETNNQLTEKSSFKGEILQEKPTNDSISISEEGCREARLDNGEVYEYYWQPYPENLKERLSWVLDLVFNARGPGWNWSIPTIPKLTPEVQSRLGGSVAEESQPINTPTEKKRFSARYEHLFSQLYSYLKCFLIADVLRVIMMNDPYFKFGPTSYDLPFYLQQLYPSVLQFYRLLLSACSVVSGVSMGFANFSIFLPYVLGPSVLGLRGEPWYYPNVLGEFSVILDKGLNGLWGGYWHQTFRLFFTAPTKYLIQEGYIKAGRYHTKIVGLFFAFSISGFMHWAASMTSFGPTSPIREGIFFLVQGLGVIFQEGLCYLFSSLIVQLPKSLRQTGNLFYTLGWLYLTGWLAADDFARAGFWLVEPLPFSPTQALGFGEYDTGWNCVKSIDLVWYTGKYWWESGITLL